MEPVPKRTNTSSTIESVQSVPRPREDLTQKPQPAPANAQAGPRRGSDSHQKLVFCDPVAFRYLEEDESTYVLARRKRLQGFEMYVVEQWVCSRVHPTFVIATYTGDPSHSILVNVLSVPDDEKTWSKRLKIYFDAVSQYHAREQETLLGTLMVTNLSAFPSGLSVISVPDGDVKMHREDFIVNENLKRMGCAGRAAMTLQPAPPSTVAKFQHLYQTSESIPFKSSVMELVRLCQTALTLYGKLNLDYADGLLCDITEKAIQDWWNDIGTDFHNIEPSDGILGPTTVSALIGLMLGAYNRLRATGVNVPKDVLDVLSMKRAVGHFQKAHKINKTRRLDRETLDRLHRVTAKTANSEGWAVPRAVKSTVAELSGKGGEMVMGAIGATRDKVAISEVETLDLEKLIQLVAGARMKWLWHGKRLKPNRDSMLGSSGADDGLNGKVFSTDEHGNYLWTSEARDSIVDQDNLDESGNHDKSNRRRLRGAAAIPGLRPHKHRLHKQSEDLSEREDVLSDTRTSRTSKEYNRTDYLLRSPASFYDRSSLELEDQRKPQLDLALAHADLRPASSQLAEVVHHSKLQPIRDRSNSGRSTHPEQLRSAHQPGLSSEGTDRLGSRMKKYHDQIQSDQYQNFATEFDQQEPAAHVLRHSKSALHIRDIETPIAYNLRLPRQLSFSLVEKSVLRFSQPQDGVITDGETEDETDHELRSKLSDREADEVYLRCLTNRLLDIEQKLFLFAKAEVTRVEELDQKSHEHLTGLNETYYQRFEDYQSLQSNSRDLVARERALLSEGLRQIEMLGQKLDYELDALQSRMQEAEDGAAEFERNVMEMEARVAELVREKRSATADQIDRAQGGAVPWVQRVVNFFGNSQQ